MRVTQRVGRGTYVTSPAWAYVFGWFLIIAVPLYLAVHLWPLLVVVAVLAALMRMPKPPTTSEDEEL